MLRIITGNITAATFTIAIFTFCVAAQTESYFQTVAGRWQGTLEYQDYTSNKRVTMKTIITIEPAADGRSATVSTTYDDFGKIYRSKSTEAIDTAASKFTDDGTVFSIASNADGRIVLLGSTQDGNTVEPTRKTITFTKDTLTILKETRSPWTFRNVYTLKRAAEANMPPVVLSPEQMKADNDVLRRALTTLHPGVYRYITPSDLDREFAMLNAKLTAPASEGDYLVLVSQLLNKLRCGHTFANPYNQNPKLRSRIFEGRTYLPFYFQIVDGRIVITANASSKKIAAGSEITRINGVAAGEIIARLLTVTRGDGTSTLEHRIDSVGLARGEAEKYALFDMYFPLMFSFKDGVFEIEAVDHATKKATTFSVLAMTKTERTEEMAKRYGPTPSYDDGWKFEIQDGSTGYLKIENFITWRLKSVKFKESLANAFAELRAKKITNLIIDVRGNGGGDMDPGFEISRYLAEQKLPPYAESRRLVRNIAAQPDLARYISTYDDGIMAAVKNGVPQSMYKAFDTDFFEIVGRESYPAVVPYADRFAGKTFMIADAANASATFQFLDYVKTNRLATIVGQPTGGNRQGINGGNYLFLSLPNSAIEVDIPMYFQAPLTTQPDQSVIPDVPVKRRPDDIGNGIDREMAEVKRLISER
ncbi:MAG: S41 family peptidase [Pyrinomonadaceae bacterium]|nr:S41 family peptidase [Pyrinomonadaceae bacterium]